MTYAKPIRERLEISPNSQKNQSITHSSAIPAKSPFCVFYNLHTPGSLNFRLSPAFSCVWKLPHKKGGRGVGNFYLMPNQQLTNSRLGTSASARPVGISHVSAFLLPVNSELPILDLCPSIPKRLAILTPHPNQSHSPSDQDGDRACPPVSWRERAERVEGSHLLPIIHPGVH